MTTEIDHNPIIPSVVRKQYQRGMTLPQLCRLYEVSETTIRPIIQGVKQGARNAGESEEEPVSLLARVKQLIEVEKLSIIAASEILDMPVPKLKRFLKDNDIETSEVYKVGKQGEKNDRDIIGKRMQELFDKGMMVKDICDELGISSPTYYYIRDELGLKLNRGRGRKKGQTRENMHQKKQAKKKPKAPNLIHPAKPKEEVPMNQQENAQETAVTALKPEEVSELIGTVQKHIEHKKPSTRVINRDKDVWAEYLTARSQEIHDVTHDVEVVMEDGKLIERTTIAYTLERELEK